MASPYEKVMLMFTPEQYEALVEVRIAQARREWEQASANCRPSEKSILNLQEFADWLGVSTRSVPRIVGRELVPHRKVGRQYRFLRAEVEAWLATRPSGTNGVAARVATIRQRTTTR